MAVGGGTKELRQLRGEVKDLWERVDFYKGMYHAVMLASQIEHYKNLM